MGTEHFSSVGHSSESLQRAAQRPDGSWVQLDDLLISLHGLGPRYALLQNATVHGRIDPADLLAVLRTVRWTKRYRLRADWPALGLC